MRSSPTDIASTFAGGGRPDRSGNDDPARRLADARAALAKGIEERQSPAHLLAAHARALDEIVRTEWNRAAPPGALFATGGYGRRELYPASDVDLAVILSEPGGREAKRRLERFIQRLWDLGLKLGASVRTVEETAVAAAADVATFTALTEARRLSGDAVVERKLQSLLAAPEMWPLPAYLAAKLGERAERYARFDGSAQRLEPSVKESPGGLRDLATLRWLGARRLGQLQSDWAELERYNLISGTERRGLGRAARTLARVRLALHHLSGRAEERLLFDLQPRIAELLGYRGRRGVLPVETMMQDYYRAARTVAQVNALLFRTPAAPWPTPEPVAPGLVSRGTDLDFEDAGAASRDPRLLLGIFRRWQQEPRLTGLAPAACRAIAAALPALGTGFRSDPENRVSFGSILASPTRVAATLRAMHDNGILGRYLPAFARITGRMQYDLFHVFTVDEHILQVIANVEEMLLGAFPVGAGQAARSELRDAAGRLDRPEVVFLAALFHDIAKGRGGNHSTLGAREARSFATRHGLAEADTDLVAWLVRHHLSLSVTAQKSDLSDRRVIADFARLVGDQRRLDYLYVLTVADVGGTNPALWNAWRDALFAQLYRATSRALWRGLAHPPDAAAEISARKHDARELLGGGNPAVSRLWNAMGTDYFLQYNPEEIAWHTRGLLAAAGPPAVFVRVAPEGAGTAVAVFAKRRTFSFARVTAALAQLGLTIVAARCVPVGRDATLDTYVVIEADGGPVEDPRWLRRIESLLGAELTRDSPGPLRVTRPTPRQVRLFPTPTRVEFGTDPEGRHTVLELGASDRPGLLAAVARAFRRCGVFLRTARVMTVGERAEDVFHITDVGDRPLDAAARKALDTAVKEEIAAEN